MTTFFGEITIYLMIIGILLSALVPFVLDRIVSKLHELGDPPCKARKKDKQ
ncbi:hypothetical protein [Brevibacillus invocatus]|uniref:hypothetical protein n=1 Tax=Brevibacillus invocatus TaxID=173959 RepID=UPI0016068207|nr:hypothetical protein [Brevibacillus invocatus]